MHTAKPCRPGASLCIAPDIWAIGPESRATDKDVARHADLGSFLLFRRSLDAPIEQPDAIARPKT